MCQQTTDYTSVPQAVLQPIYKPAAQEPAKAAKQCQVSTIIVCAIKCKECHCFPILQAKMQHGNNGNYLTTNDFTETCSLITVPLTYHKRYFRAVFSLFFFFFFFLQEVCYYIRDKVLKESLFFSDGSFVFFSEAT